MADDALDWFYCGNDLTFAHSEAATITAVPSATLQNWGNRGLLPGLVTGVGKGRKREYSAGLLSTIIFARDLVDLGFETGLAAHIGVAIHIELLKHLADLLKAGRSGRDKIEAFTCAVALIKPDRKTLKHDVQIADYRHVDAETFKPSRGVIFYPAGYAVIQAITRALDEKKNTDRPSTITSPEVRV